MKSALLIACLHAASFGMMWEPFPNCTESHQVDSIRTLVWIDESLKPELAPYLGYARFRYHPGTCFVARFEFKPYYMDSSFVLERTLSADRRRQDYRLIAPGSQEYLPHGTTWFSAAGEVDSSLHHSYSQVEGEPPVRMSHLEVRRRSAQGLVITGSYRTGEGPWAEYDKDSVVFAGGVTVVHSIEDSVGSVIHCAAEGSTFACEPTPPGGGTGDVGRRVWHLTGNRPDSLRTYRPDGRLESTDHWSWSPRELTSIRRVSQRPRFLAGPEFGRFNLLGRILSEN